MGTYMYVLHVAAQVYISHNLITDLSIGKKHKHMKSLGNVLIRRDVHYKPFIKLTYCI